MRLMVKQTSLKVDLTEKQVKDDWTNCIVYYIDAGFIFYQTLCVTWRTSYFARFL